MTMEKLASLVVLFFKVVFYWSWMVCTAPGAACWALLTTCCYLGLAATCCAFYYAAWVILRLAVYCCQRVLRLLLSPVPLPAPAAASQPTSSPAGLQQKAPATTTTTADNSIPDVDMIVHIGAPLKTDKTGSAVAPAVQGCAHLTPEHPPQETTQLAPRNLACPAPANELERRAKGCLAGLKLQRFRLPFDRLTQHLAKDIVSVAKDVFRELRDVELRASWFLACYTKCLFKAVKGLNALQQYNLHATASLLERHQVNAVFMPILQRCDSTEDLARMAGLVQCFLQCHAPFMPCNGGAASDSWSEAVQVLCELLLLPMPEEDYMKLRTQLLSCCTSEQLAGEVFAVRAHLMQL
ncbi:hypothetical protein OEZ86_006830 [Tetradesmus obliquus]|nr:hypothetical protein OEZ86_006830 [Tetradesmus obliquus]